MIIAQASDKRLRRFIDRNIENCQKFGHTFQVYDLGELGLGIRLEVPEGDLEWSKGTPLAPCRYRFIMIRDALEKDSEVLALDGDAIVNKKIDLDFDFDLAVTVRRENEPNQELPYISKINAGVTAIKNTAAFRTFLTKWEELAQEKGDQHALNDLVKPDTRDGTMYVDGMKVRCLPCEKWNDYYMDGTDPYILHYKAGLKDRFK